MKLIGLSGYEYSGKSTTTSAIMLHRPRAVMVSFADCLKRMLMELGVPRRNLYGNKADKEAPLAILGGKSTRWAMRTLGTEWGRDLIWVNLWVAKLERDLEIYDGDKDRLILIDDVRFPNEAAWIRSKGGRIYMIRNPNTEDADISHRSQALIEELDFDQVLINDYPDASTAGIELAKRILMLEAA